MGRRELRVRGIDNRQPSLEMTTGSSDPVRPASSSKRRPSAELLSWVTCGTPFRINRLRSGALVRRLLVRGWVEGIFDYRAG